MQNRYLLKMIIIKNQTKQCDEPPQTKTATADSTIGTDAQRSEHRVESQISAETH